MSYNITYLLQAVFCTYTIFRMVRVFCGNPSAPSWLVWSGYMLHFAVTSSVYLILRIPMLVLAANVIAVFAVTCLYKVSWRSRMISTVFIYMINIFVETVIVLLLGYSDLPVMEKSTFSSQWGLVIIRLVTFGTTIFMEQYRHVRAGGSLLLKYALPVMAIPVLSVSCAISILSWAENYSYQVTPVIVFLLLINFSAVYLYDALSEQAVKQREQAVLETEKAAYEKQLEIMCEMSDSLSTVRHDMKNHLITLQGYAQTGCTAEILPYIGKMSGQLRLYENLINTGNPAIDSICNFKIVQAREKGIVILPELHLPTALSLDGYDITVILGNLLDNAVEALEKITRKPKEIHLQMKYDRGRLLLSVSNFCEDGLVPEKNRMGHFSSSKKTGRYGLGLYHVEKVVAQYDGGMEVEIQNGVFRILVMLPLRDYYKNT